MKNKKVPKGSLTDYKKKPDGLSVKLRKILPRLTLKISGLSNSAMINKTDNNLMICVFFTTILFFKLIIKVIINIDEIIETAIITKYIN
ncbi:hypothetical protein, partial [Escherichia coli]|uniref:hypothetical protein n=1 Tax=Escherichia coli TaxID=562 RepID=UPI00198246AD